MTLTLSNPIVVATKNKGKVQEFAHAFGKLGLSVVSMFDYPNVPDVVEDGLTFAENARKKAREIGDALGLTVLADDSGLEVELLDGAPGIYSARYAGEGANDALNNQKLLVELARLVEDKSVERLHDGTALLSAARFVCTLALYEPSSQRFVDAEGTVGGFILDAPRGEGGFGYDPLFYVPSLDKTTAQLTKDEKQAISHRGAALVQLLEKLQ